MIWPNSQIPHVAKYIDWPRGCLLLVAYVIDRPWSRATPLKTK